MDILLDNIVLVSVAIFLIIAFFSWFGKIDRERRTKKRIERQARIYARKVYEAWTNYKYPQADNLLGEYMSEDRTQKPKTEKKKKAFNRKKIIALLKKLRELARRGVGGERENAERMFYEMLNKYGILESELG